MQIVSGRGNRRSVFVFPSSHFVKKSPADQQKAALNLLCGMMGIHVPENPVLAHA
jgi:hypothetical protein